MRSMSPGEERRSLEECPLPPEIATEDDTYLPAKIYRIDMHILALQDSLRVLERNREDLMKRALEVGALEDEYCRILFKERTSRILNVEKFRETYPAIYEQICDRDVAALRKRIAEVGKTISLQAADTLAGKEAVTALCELKVDRTPYVVPRRDPIIVTEG